MELLALFINLSCLLCGAVSSLHQLVLFVACSCPFLFINFLVTFELSTKVFFLINLSCLLCGAIHFSSSTSLSSLSYQPRYSFLFMILLVGRLVCLFIFVKIYFYMVQITITIYLSCNFSEYFQFFFSYNFISSTNIHCIFYFFFCFFNSCTLHWFIFYVFHQKSFVVFFRYTLHDVLPTSFSNSNVSLRWKQWKSKELKHTSWFATFWK
jgi:hypothetical protein